MTEPPNSSDPQTAWDDLHDRIDLERTRSHVLGRLFGGARTPTRIGRFIISGTAGEGEMGRVYVGHDPELDREVAIKIIRSGSAGEERAAARRARLRREAQALASLQHPNVIAVHEVGRHDEDVFIVMEYIRGPSLRVWLEQPRTSAEILRVFIGAAQGLDAAHANGLVHRDFKPDNVLVAPDGRAVVLDFGLVQAADPASTTTSSSFDAALELPLGRLTRTGGVVGTPAYMSPEQMRGQTADPRSDQFSFCVALFEALSGSRPFAGATTTALCQAIERGDVASARGTPRWLHAALVRGLSFEPQDRFPSMAAWVAMLDRKPGSRRRIAAVALGAAGVGAIAMLSRDDEPRAAGPDCGGGEARVAEVWSPERAEVLRHAFAQSEQPYAEALAVRVVGALDLRRDGWAAMHRDACEATHLRHEQSERLLDLRMACLNRALANQAAAIEVLVDPDPKSIERAATVVSRLPDLSECADVQGLVAQTPLPADRRTRASIEAASERLARARTLDAAAHYDEALEIVEALRVDPAVESYAPLRARTLFVYGRLLRALGDDRMERAFLDAVSVAEGHHQDAVAIMCWRSLAEDTKGSAEADQRAEGYFERLEAAVTRLGSPLLERARLDRTRGRIALRDGEYGAAVEYFGNVVEMLAKLDKPALDGAVRMDLAAAWFRLGKHERAAEEFARVEAIFADIHGPEHPYTARAMINRGQALLVMGHNREAIGVLTRARAIEVAALGPDHTKVAQASNALASAHYQLGEFERAGALYADAIRISEGALGPEHPLLGPPLANLARVLTQLDRHQEAIAAARRAVQITEAAKGLEHPELVTLLSGLGHVYARAQRLDDAAASQRRAIELGEKTLGEDHVRVAYSRRSLAEVELRRGRVNVALETAQRAESTIASGLGARHPQRASALVTLGRIERKLSRRADAQAHLSLAVDIYLEAEAPPEEIEGARRELAAAKAG